MAAPPVAGIDVGGPRKGCPTDRDGPTTPLARPVATERLWLTQPRRTTSLSKVVAVRGSWFALDRSLFAPTSRAHRHPQPHDEGVAWIGGGQKRILQKSFERDGTLWHTLRGTTPEVGATVNCQLDQERRDSASRAHTAMHLFVAALRRHGAPALRDDPAVKGGATFRLELARPVAPTDLAAALALANQWTKGRHAVSVEHVVRGLEARVLDAQVFDPPDPYPGPPATVTAVRIDGVCCYPCDGTHAADTTQVGRIVLAHARASGGGMSVVGQVIAHRP